MNHTTALRGSAAVLLIAYFAAAFLPTLPEGAYADARVAALLGGGERTAIVAGGYLWAVAGVAALAFAHLLAAALPATRPAAAAAVRAAGSGYGVMLLVASIAFTAVPMGIAVGELPGGAPVETFRVLTQAGFFALLVPGLLCGAVMVVATSLAMRGGNGPKWLVSTGFVVAPLLLLGFAWVPQFLVPLWALGVSLTVRAVPQPTVVTDYERSGVEV